MVYVIRMANNANLKSSRWYSEVWIRGHPDELAPGSISSRWFMTNAGCHPDDLPCCLMSSGWHNEISTSSHMSSGWHNEISTSSHPGELVRDHISSRWPMTNTGCHPDDVLCCPISSGWLNVIWTLSHLDDLAPGRISWHLDDLWPM